VSMNALAAYNKGATGAGVNLAIIDSGIDTDSAEFGNRISSASTDVAGTRPIDDIDGHGTAVAFAAAGRRNGGGSQGVAFDSTLIVLRADAPGSCASTGSTTTDESSCSFETTAIARGVDTARAAGAKVINISLGGSAMPANLAAAIGRATATGIIVVIAAGNDSSSNVDPFAGVANDDAVARNLVIVAGSVGSGDAISSFSDRAGDAATHYLAAVGERVRAPDATGSVFLWSGTSFAAPQISGAIALLAQAFPNMSGAQIVDLLYRTARDAGAAGVDNVYGNGILDLTRAFQPVGTSSLAGSKVAVSLDANATLSAPMGDAATGGLGAVILDSYARAFAIDLATTIRRASPQPALLGALQANLRAVAVQRGGMTVALTLAPQANGDVTLQHRALTTRDAQSARAIAGMISQQVGERTQIAVGFAQTGGALSAQLAGMNEPSFLVAADGGTGFDSRAASAGAVRHRLAGFGITATIENGDIVSHDTALLAGLGGDARSSYNRMTVALDRRFGGIATALAATSLAEADTLLGARFGGGLGAARATTRFVDARARWISDRGWTLGFSARRGWSEAQLRGGYAGSGTLMTSAYAADLGKDGVFGRDSIGLRVAQPLRVARGGIDYLLPTYYDYSTGSVTDWTWQRLNLAPTGRELIVEGRYRIAMSAGDLQANMFWRRDPGNFATLSPDYGVALRYGVGF
ncbi:MAG: S8 family serine peptidase, partial [Sphingomonas bacterium]|nr:S8 family serine peptidase [Sphingomonas bacterium]